MKQSQHCVVVKVSDYDLEDPGSVSHSSMYFTGDFQPGTLPYPVLPHKDVVEIKWRRGE